MGESDYEEADDDFDEEGAAVRSPLTQLTHSSSPNLAAAAGTG
jgi:hypothetical protein